MDALEKSSLATAALGGEGAIIHAAGLGGGMLGRGIGQAFGAKTPEEAKQARLSEVAAQFPDLDTNDPEQLTQVQSALWQAGLYDQANQVGEQAREAYKSQTDRIAAEKTTAGAGTEFERYIMSKAMACNGDVACLQKVTELRDAHYQSNDGQGTAKYQNVLKTSQSLVNQYGGTIANAVDFVWMNPTGTAAFDLGTAYQRFLEQLDMDKQPTGDAEAGEVVPADDESVPVSYAPRTLEQLDDDIGSNSRLMTGAPPQDIPGLKARSDYLNNLKDSLHKHLDNIRNYAKDNVQPIGNELKNISDVRTFWSEAEQGNVLAINRLKTSLAKLGGDNRVGIQEVQTTLGGGDILLRLERGLVDLLAGSLIEKDADDVKRIIDALYAKYNEKMSGVIDRGRGAYSGVVADKYLDMYLPRPSAPQVTPEEREAARAEYYRRHPEQAGGH